MNTVLNGGGWRRWAAAGVVVVLVVPLVVLAVRSQGEHATKVNLDDGGVWVVNGEKGLVGRINTQIGALEVALAPPGQDLDVEQVDEAVAVRLLDGGDDQIAVVDVGLGQLGRPSAVPAEATVSVGGPTAALADGPGGKVWVADRARIGQLDTSTTPPTIEPGKGTVTAVGVDGTAYAHAEGTDVLHVVSAGGDTSTVGLPFRLRRAELTAVGDQPVVLDPESGRLVLPDGRVVDLGPGREPRLQVPGEPNGDVLVATDDALLAVSLGEGAVRTVREGPDEEPVAPVFLRGCAFSAWRDGTWGQQCGGRDREGRLARRPSGELRFRVNRGRVVLNDLASGDSLLFTDDEPVLIQNWAEVNPRTDNAEQPNEEIIQKPNDDCEADASDVELAPDVHGTRPGRPVIVPVLDNDRFTACQVPAVTIAERPPAEVADVAIVRDGTAVQVTPQPSRREPVRFRYQVVLGGRTAETEVTVNVIDPASNRAPVTKNDTTTVVAGRMVRHPVLDNDTDPDGDALTLVSAVLTGDGSFTSQADGLVTYTASGTSTGEQTLRYTVADEHGATTTGLLKVVVTEEGKNVAPAARNDRIEVVVGRRERLDLVANDSDPNGDPLTVSELKGVPASLDIRREGTTEIDITARRPGTFTFSYTISDGEAQAEGQVRVDALESTENHPPVAVRDDLVVRPGVPDVRNLVENDLDPDGDLLAVTSVTSTEPGLTVALINLHVVRVTAPAGLDRSIDVRYTLTDGKATSEGVLVVRPYRTARVDQAPVAGPDERTVRAGNIVSVPVLDNDVDPEGERLKLVGVDQLRPEQGQVFVQGEELRYRAPAGGAATVRFSYTVEDPGGNRADGLVTMRVVPVDQPNQPPTAPDLEARVFAGGETVIPVPLIGSDPDGDVVTVVGVSVEDGQQPTKGHVTLAAGGLLYRADRGASGTDVFGFVVRDAGGLEATGQARVAVVPRPAVNGDPVAAPDRATVQVGTSFPVRVLDNDSDPDGDPLELLLDGPDAPSQPRGAKVTPGGDRGVLVVAVDADAAPGEVSFSYTVTDGRGGTARGVVTVSISLTPPPNQPPLARDDVVEAQGPGSTTEVPVLANDLDPEGRPLRVEVVGETPGAEAAVLPDGRIRVTVGDRSVAVVYSITDAGGAVAYGVVTVPVAGDRPPVCQTGTAEVAPGGEVAVDVAAFCRDPEGAGVSIVRVFESARGGSVRLDGTRVLFTAAGEVRGDAGFEFVVSDGVNQSVGGVVVRVTGQSDPPTFALTEIDVPAGGERVVDLQALVIDLDAQDRHSFSNLQGATAEITATLDGGRLRVRAADGARGARADLTVTVSDGTHDVPGRLTVLVQRHDGQPPVAVDDRAQTTQGQSVTVPVTDNDIDPLGRGLTVTYANSPDGSADVVGGRQVRFTPRGDLVGEAIVTYGVTDASGDAERSGAATLRVSIIGRPSPPPAPTGIAESRQVRLTWGAAQPNGAPIERYVVEHDRGGRRESASTSLLFDGLDNGRPYRFRVAARNAAVRSDSDLQFSAWSNPITPDAAPGTPAPPRLTFGNGSIRLNWTPPSNDGSPIRTYQLRISGGGQATVRDVGPVTDYTWGGLTNGALYTFSVRAENGQGPGEWSSPSNDPLNGVPAGPPGQVPDVTAVSLSRDLVNGGVVRVTWGAPFANGDGQFTFTVTASPNDGGAGATRTIVDPAARSVDFSNLRFGVPYTFRVTARNKAGEGPPGTSTVTPSGPPGAPGGVNASAGDRSVTLASSAPTDNGAGITGWEASINGGGATRVNGPTGVPAGSPVNVTVPNLANGTGYSFRLRACNSVGCGAWSPASNTVTPFGNPTAPTVSASVSLSTITWNWTASNGNGSPIRHYNVFLDGGLVTTTQGTSFSRDFPGGVNHSVVVEAVNEGGRTARSSPSTAMSFKTVQSTPGTDADSVFERLGAGGREQVDVIQPGQTVWVQCRQYATPDIGSNDGWYYLLESPWRGWWAPATNYNGGSLDSSVRLC
jgi:hypothetical protein